jgi:hypothetical protein
MYVCTYVPLLRSLCSRTLLTWNCLKWNTSLIRVQIQVLLTWNTFMIKFLGGPLSFVLTRFDCICVHMRHITRCTCCLHSCSGKFCSVLLHAYISSKLIVLHTHIKYTHSFTYISSILIVLHTYQVYSHTKVHWWIMYFYCLKESLFP